MKEQPVFLDLKPKRNGRTNKLSRTGRQVPDHGDHQGASELILTPAMLTERSRMRCGFVGPLPELTTRSRPAKDGWGSELPSSSEPPSLGLALPPARRGRRGPRRRFRLRGAAPSAGSTTGTATMVADIGPVTEPDGATGRQTN